MLKHARHPGKALLITVNLALAGCEGGPTASRFPRQAEIAGLSLEADVSIVDRSPDLLEIHVRVQNDGTQPISVLHGECPLEEVTLYRVDEPEIPAWKESGLCFLPAYPAFLAPGDSIPHRGQFAPRWRVDLVLGDSLPDGRYEAVARVRFDITGRGEAEVEEEVDYTLSAGTVILTRDQPPLPSMRTLDDIRWTASSREIDENRFAVLLQVENLGKDEEWIPSQRGCPMDIWIYSREANRNAAWKTFPFRTWPLSECDLPNPVLGPMESRTFADTVRADAAFWGTQPEGTWHLAIVHPVLLNAGTVTLDPAQ